MPTPAVPARDVPAPVRAALAVLLAGALLGGCGLDTGPLEAEIEAGLEGSADGIEIDRVECPGGIQPERGRVFVCRAHAADGSIGTVEVEQVDDDGAVEWELTDVAAPSPEES